MRPIRLILTAVAAVASIALGVPAAAAAPAAPTAGPAVVAQAAPSAAGQVLTDRGRDRDRVRHRRFGGFGGFGFPVVTPFFTGGFGGLGFGFDGGFSSHGGSCDIFLAVGDLNSYILCRVG